MSAVTYPDPWREDPSKRGPNQPEWTGQAPVFPPASQSPADYPPIGYPQPGYPPYAMPQQFNHPGAYAPFGVDPMTGFPFSDKSKVAAGLLSIFLGYFGAGRFYAGHTGLAVAQLVTNIVLTILTLGFWLAVAWIWPLIDGLVLLTGSPRDAQGRPLR